jgi:hypothetical protein
MIKSRLINLLSFQILWFICVLADNVLAVIALALFFLVHFFCVLQNKIEWLLIVAFTLIGLVFESAINSLDLIHFSAAGKLVLGNTTITLAPIWLLCLWAGFAATFSHGLFALRKYPLGLAILIVPSVPISYFLGARISDSTFPASPILALLCELVAWLILIPVGLWVAEKYINPKMSS